MDAQFRMASVSVAFEVTLLHVALNLLSSGKF